jgi:hypothetical protein
MLTRPNLNFLVSPAGVYFKKILDQEGHFSIIYTVVVLVLCKWGGVIFNALRRDKN